MAFNLFKNKPSSPATTSKMLAGTAGKGEVKKTIPKRVGASCPSLPHITEKAGMLQAQNQYVFKVIPGSTKYGVKDSVEAQYGVKVSKVRMITIASKSIRVGRIMGRRPGYKKAVVTLKEGHKIEMGA